MGNFAMSHHLSDEQIRSFRENGFLALESFLGEEDLTPVEREYDLLLDQVARSLFAAGEITSVFADLPFGERYTALLRAYPKLYKFLNISLPLENGPRKAEDFSMHAGPAVFGLLRNEKLLDVAESILGPEIYSNPVQQMRMKPPSRLLGADNGEYSNIGATTWHQDTVALLPEADQTEVLTIWVAVTEATVEKGCLVSVPRSHKRGPVTHCPGKLLASEPNVPPVLVTERGETGEALAKPQPLPVKRGGIILFNKFNLHCALPNRSDSLRWSFDLRYSPVGQPTGRPAFPGFVARSRSAPERELRDPQAWRTGWEAARERLLNGEYQGPIFEQARWEDNATAPVCA